jgi:hypothetical protein
MSSYVVAKQCLTADRQSLPSDDVVRPQKPFRASWPARLAARNSIEEPRIYSPILNPDMKPQYSKAQSLKNSGSKISWPFEKFSAVGGMGCLAGVLLGNDSCGRHLESRAVARLYIIISRFGAKEARSGAGRWWLLVKL